MANGYGYGYGYGEDEKHDKKHRQIFVDNKGKQIE